MITRRAALLSGLAWSPRAAAQEAKPESADVAERLVLDASRALQGGNSWRFLSYCDKKAVEDFFTLRENVTALIEQRDVASSVAVEVVEVSGDRVVLDVDWLLQLTWKREVGPVEGRRETVRVVADAAPKKPKIIDIRPIAFFGPGSP